MNTDKAIQFYKQWYGATHMQQHPNTSTLDFLNSSGKVVGTVTMLQMYDTAKKLEEEEKMALSFKEINEVTLQMIESKLKQQASYEDAGIAQLKKAFENSKYPSWDQYVNAPAPAPAQTKGSYIQNTAIYGGLGAKGWKPTSLKQLYCPSAEDIAQFRPKNDEVKMQGGTIQVPIQYAPSKVVPNQDVEKDLLYYINQDAWNLFVQKPKSLGIITNIDTTEPEL